MRPSTMRLRRRPQFDLPYEHTGFVAAMEAAGFRQGLAAQPGGAEEVDPRSRHVDDRHVRDLRERLVGSALLSLALLALSMIRPSSSTTTPSLARPADRRRVLSPKCGRRRALSVTGLVGAARRAYGDEPANSGSRWEPAGGRERVEAVTRQLVGRDILAKVAGLGALPQQFRNHVSEELLRSNDLLVSMQERR